MKVEIKVKQKHIKNGEAGECSACPIALAAMETFGITVSPKSTDQVRVSEHLVVQRGPKDFVPGYLRVRAALPTKARNFINAFDNGEKVKPFTFSVTI